MKTLDVTLIDGDVICVSPVRCIYRQSLDWLLNQIHLTYQTSGFGDIGKLYLLGQKLVNLLPRLDIVDTLGFDVGKLDQDTFESLFIADKFNGEYVPCKIVQLHSFEPPKTKPQKEKSPLPPIPSSGLPEIDLFASLIGIDETIDGAYQLWKTLDMESIYAVIHQLNELRKSPDDRMNEHLAEQYDIWKAQNPIDYYSMLGNFNDNNDQLDTGT